MGQKITKLKPVGGFCAETGGAATLFMATYLGVPVSTTHTITGAIVGVGTGSTVNFFIDELARMKGRIDGAVSSSEASAQRLKAAGIPVFDLNSVRELPVYVDGADEVTRHLMMIKGGGGALTREKIVAAVARQFICIADTSKLVDVLGKFPLPVEVIPMAIAQITRAFAALGGEARVRPGVLTDNGHPILDVGGQEGPGYNARKTVAEAEEAGEGSGDLG